MGVNVNYLMTGEGEMLIGDGAEYKRLLMKSENRVADLERDLDRAYYLADKLEKMYKSEISKAIEKGLKK